MYFDLKDKKITKETNILKSKLKKNYLIDGTIIYTDCINGTIKEISRLINQSKKKILILFDKQNRKIWYENIKNSNYVGENDIIKDIGSKISFSKVQCIDKLKQNNFYQCL